MGKNYLRTQFDLCATPPVVLLALVMSVMICGCSSFNREWRKATAQPAHSGALEGPWQGQWKSEQTGHKGKLRCLIVKVGDDSYLARFHAKYAKIMGFKYTVPLKAERTNDQFQFKGEADLGKLAGGVYHYDGHADSTNFFSNYSSKADHGTFQMSRP
jgi:hypothetical protein